MTRAAIVVLGMLAISALPSIAFAQDKVGPGPSPNSQSQSAFDGIKESRVSVPQAIDVAEKASGGHAVEAVFTPHARGGGNHDVVILQPDGGLKHYYIDANNSVITGATDLPLSNLYTRFTKDKLTAAKTTLTQAVGIAEAQKAGDRAIAGAVELEGDGVAYNITLAGPDGDKTFDVSADGQITNK